MRNPSKIFNLDETSTATVQKPKRLLKGRSKSVTSTSSDGSVFVNTCDIISVLFDFGRTGLANTNGWVTVELFRKVLCYFIQYYESTKDNSLLLMHNNYEIHVSKDVVNIARDNGSTIITLPPYCGNEM